MKVDVKCTVGKTHVVSQLIYYACNYYKNAFISENKINSVLRRHIERHVQIIMLIKRFN